MIGVLANPSDQDVVREFFELFKTPWEFYRIGRTYSVVLCADDAGNVETDAPLVIVYTSTPRGSDAGRGEQSASKEGARIFSYRESSLPLYFASCTFDSQSPTFLLDPELRRPVVCETEEPGRKCTYVGYDLFHEVRYLLTAGQPVAYGAHPTLDLHVALLRELICRAGVELIEVPPVPSGYRLTACLTHDVDHPLVRNHRLDRTTLGFLYRAILGSVVDLVRGRTSFLNVLTNWCAVAKLPLVHLGLAKDFWSEFDRYTEIDGRGCSTLFLIPFEGVPGVTSVGSAPGIRGARYGVVDVTNQIDKILAADCEVGLHGIDAWFDVSRAGNELNEVKNVTCKESAGVRMHWLFSDEQSPAVLEAAGAAYDSTVGYNETVGYRAGTSQIYKPLNTSKLLELPLHIMDTALFYPTRLNLSPREALNTINQVIDHAVVHGGCVTVNWHDRSIAPERLWTATYTRLIEGLKQYGAWFATASQAVEWARTRRAVSFEMTQDGRVRAMLPRTSDARLPGLTLRKYAGACGEFVDMALTLGDDFVLTSELHSPAIA
jgi:hypothetical protein